MTRVHPFDQALELAPQGPNEYSGHTSAAYMNLVGPHGGVVAAQALNAVMAHPQRLGDPISLTVNFAAALENGPFRICAEPVRTNRSTQHWVLYVRQHGSVIVTATVLSGLRRETWSVDETCMPGVPSPDAAAAVEAGLHEACVGRYEMRFVEGGFPAHWDGMDAGTSRTRLWFRDHPRRALDFCSLAALSDTFCPLIWRRRPRRVAMGTVSLTTYFHASAEDLVAVGEDYLLGQVQAHAFRRGYSDQSGQIWNRSGRLLATTHQIVYYRE